MPLPKSMESWWQWQRQECPRWRQEGFRRPETEGPSGIRRFWISWRSRNMTVVILCCGPIMPGVAVIILLLWLRKEQKVNCLAMNCWILLFLCTMIKGVYLPRIRWKWWKIFLLESWWRRKACPMVKWQDISQIRWLVWESWRNRRFRHGWIRRRRMWRSGWREVKSRLSFRQKWMESRQRLYWIAIHWQS